ncbi:MAG: PAS domain-containing sensor histidine kinase [Alphaproteobacteria bacterium]|nr:PAS domain-containing sensor histidine kinase [Alphaproteobacteria bacterium]
MPASAALAAVIAAAATAAWARDRRRAAAAAEAFATAKSRFDGYIEAASDWYWEMGPDLRFTFVSASNERHSGIQASAHIGKTRRETRMLDISEEELAAHEALLDSRLPFRNFRFSRLDKAGRRRRLTISGNPVFGKDGAFLGYRGIGRDITEEVEFREAAATAETRLREALESSSDAISLWDSQDRLVLCNEAFRATGETARRMAIGTAYVDFLHKSVAAGEIPEAQANPHAWVAQRLHDRAERNKNEVVRSGRWFLRHEEPTRDGGCLMVMVDITEIRAREQRLRHLSIEAEAASRAKSSFLAYMSHELRTPLNAIIGFTELALMEPKGPIGHPAYKEYLCNVKRAGTHLLALINGLLDLSRIEAGKQDVRMEPVMLRAVVRDAIDLMAPRAAAAGVRLEADIHVERVGADRRMLEQVLLNLLSNAVAYTPQDGSVVVRATERAPGLATIEVADTGIGMSERDLAVALEPFGRADNALQSRTTPGAGLGLPITKRLVELMQGSFALHSKKGAGTTARIELAATPTASGPAA